jgi:hypothetical protein
MIAITVPELSAYEIMGIVEKMRKDGMVQGLDFNFSYHPSEQDSYAYDPASTKPRYTVFEFYNEKYAVFFSLRYL